MPFYFFPIIMTQMLLQYTQTRCHSTRGTHLKPPCTRPGVGCKACQCPCLLNVCVALTGRKLCAIKKKVACNSPHLKAWRTSLDSKSLFNYSWKSAQFKKKKKKSWNISCGSCTDLSSPARSFYPRGQSPFWEREHVVVYNISHAKRGHFTWHYRAALNSTMKLSWWNTEQSMKWGKIRRSHRWGWRGGWDKDKSLLTPVPVC